jgi:hypothetical protein
MRIMLVLTAAGVLVSGAANADNPAPAKKDDSQKKICKTEEFVGSMIPKRICMTRADWERQAQMDKDAMDVNALSRARMEPPVVKPGG